MHAWLPTRKENVLKENRSAEEKRTWIPKISIGICSTF